MPNKVIDYVDDSSTVWPAKGMAILQKFSVIKRTLPQALQWCLPRLKKGMNSYAQAMHILASLLGIQYGLSMPSIWRLDARFWWLTTSVNFCMGKEQHSWVNKIFFPILCKEDWHTVSKSLKHTRKEQEIQGIHTLTQSSLVCWSLKTRIPICTLP